MKLRNLIIVALFAIALNSQAQDYKSAIGLRLGSPMSASYKTFINSQDALEFFVGYRSYGLGYKFFNIGGLYEHHTPISSAKGLSWYYGGGAQAFFWSYDELFNTGHNYSTFTVGITGCLGLDYKFDNTPINISLDWLPTFIIGGYVDGFASDYFDLSIRYVLK